MREKLFIGIGIAMALALAWAATQPAGAATGAKLWHQATHFAAFAVFAAVWTRGLPRSPLWAIIAAVAVFGLLQEWYEIYGHHHPFEFLDVVVDALGAIAGGACARLCARL